MAQAKTVIGTLKARIDVPAHGQSADGTHRVLMNFVPTSDFNLHNPLGIYRYWKQKLSEHSTREFHQWSSYCPLTNQWKDAENRRGALWFPQSFQWGIELAAQEFDCNVFMEFRVESLDPNNPEDRALYLNIHIFELKEMKDLNRFIQAFASRINQRAKDWQRESADWSEPCI